MSMTRLLLATLSTSQTPRCLSFAHPKDERPLGILTAATTFFNGPGTARCTPGQRGLAPRTERLCPGGGVNGPGAWREPSPNLTPGSRELHGQMHGSERKVVKIARQTNADF